MLLKRENGSHISNIDSTNNIYRIFFNVLCNFKKLNKFLSSNNLKTNWWIFWTRKKIDGIRNKQDIMPNISNIISAYHAKYMNIIGIIKHWMNVTKIKESGNLVKITNYFNKKGVWDILFQQG